MGEKEKEQEIDGERWLLGDPQKVETFKKKKKKKMTYCPCTIAPGVGTWHLLG
jgi:hypothetical protein